MGNETSSQATHVIHNIQTNVEQRIGQAKDLVDVMRHWENGRPPPSADDVSRADATAAEGGIAPDPEPEPLLTHEQIQIVKKSWVVLQGRVQEIGILTFLRMFDQYPETKEAFAAFRHSNAEELKSNAVFHNHASRVIRVIEKVIERLEEPAKCRSYLTILAQKHVYYDADPQYMHLMGSMVLYTIQPILEEEDAWTAEISEAWEILILRVIVGTMRDIMVQALEEEAAAKAAEEADDAAAAAAEEMAEDGEAAEEEVEATAPEGEEEQEEEDASQR